MNYKKIWSEVITASLIIIISAVAIVSFIVISGQDVDVYNPSDKIAISKGSNKISEVLNLLQTKYMGEVKVDDLIDGAIEGMFSKIDDPYTRYLSEEEYSEIVSAGTETYYGIGVHLSINIKTKQITVIGVMPDSPAKKAGIRAGDIVLKVNDTEANIDNYYESVDNIKGEEGTEVKLEILSNGENKTLKVTRTKIVANNIESEVIQGLGYIRVLAFENNIYNQFKEQYDKLIDENKVKGLIIDLRNNPGGHVSETVKIADMLVGEGTILKEVYGDGVTKTYTSDKNKSSVPIVVLVNENSASAAEILAGSIKDLKQGTLVGTTTFGKGIVQSIIKLENGGGLSITTAKYYTAAGEEIHGKGIAPDVEVKLRDENVIDYSINPDKDPQLKEAVKILLKNAN